MKHNYYRMKNIKAAFKSYTIIVIVLAGKVLQIKLHFTDQQSIFKI